MGLEEIGGTNLRTLAKEIEALMVYIGNRESITLEDIHALSAETSTSIFAFNEAMKQRNKKVMLESVKKLMENGDDPIKLLGLITANIRLYHQVLLRLQNREAPNSIAKALGKNPYYLSKIVPDIRNHYSLHITKAAYTRLSETDTAIKQGKLPPKRAIELAVLHI